MKFKLGDTDIPFVFRGDELMYPNYVKDGLVLHYDFSGMTNADASRGVATDLSGNGNHGTLQNFNYTAESGYDKNKLLFDGVDDELITNKDFPSYRELSIEFVNNPTEKNSGIAKSNTPSWAANEWGVRDISGRHRLYFSDGSGVYELDAFKVIGEKVHWVFMLTLEGMFVYRNGVLISRNNTSSALMRFVNHPIVIGNSYTTDFGDTAYNSIKIYNRPLTPEEIAHNYQIEKERFNI